MTDEQITAFFEEEENSAPRRTESRRAFNRRFKFLHSLKSAGELFRTKHEGVYDAATHKIKPVSWRRYYNNISFFKRKANKAVRRYVRYDDDGTQLPMMSGKQYRKVYDYAWTVG